MNFRFLIFDFGLAASFCLLCLAAAAQDNPQTAEAPVGWERYKFLAQHNIFSRDPVSGGKHKTGEAEVAPEALIVVSGILQEDGQLQIVLENRKTGATQVVRVGDEVAGGKITGCTLDGLEYLHAGASSVVKVGKTLAGGAAPAAPPKAAEAHTEGGSSDSSAAAERLKKKRQEELQK
jgi:hypothetical protein